MATKLLQVGDCSAPRQDFPLSVAINVLPVVVSVSRGQGIQTRAFFRDDGAGGICRVRGNCVLYPSRRSWQDCGGAVSLRDGG